MDGRHRRLTLFGDCVVDGLDQLNIPVAWEKVYVVPDLFHKSRMSGRTVSVMEGERISWPRGAWTTAPVSVERDGDRLVVEAIKGSDYWRGTLYGFQHENGHALLAPWQDTHAVEVSFSLTGFTGLYDQAGLMLWRDQLHWIKAGIEINDGLPHLAVVVTDERSDWSLSPVPDWEGRIVTVRASRMNDAVILRACVDDEPWRTLRVARFDHPEGKQAGPMLCAPTRAGLSVTFTRWIHTAPDTDLHADPPAFG